MVGVARFLSTAFMWISVVLACLISPIAIATFLLALVFRMIADHLDAPRIRAETERRLEIECRIHERQERARERANARGRQRQDDVDIMEFIS